MDDNGNDHLFRFPVPVPVAVAVPDALEISTEIIEFCRKLRDNDPCIFQVDTGRFQNLSDAERIAIAQSMTGSSVVKTLVLDPENFSEKAAEAMATVICSSSSISNKNTYGNGNGNTQSLQIVEIDSWIEDFHLLHLRQQMQMTVSILMGGIQASTSVTELSL
jgi:hypothetical protein